MTSSDNGVLHNNNSGNPVPGGSGGAGGDGGAPDFSNALEKAKAMAARFAAGAKAPRAEDEPSHGTKRPNEESDHDARPPPSSSYRKQEDGSDRQPFVPEMNSGSAPVDDQQQQQAQTQYQQPPQHQDQHQHQYAPPQMYQQPPNQYGSAPMPYGHAGPPATSHYGPPMDVQKVVVVVPPGKAGIVIGRGGETLKGIERQFNVRIQLEPSGPSGDIEKTATITGGAREIEEASKAVQDIISGMPRGGGFGYSGGAAGATPYGAAPAFGMNTAHVRVPTAHVGLVIGKGGETIKSLQQRSGARITVAKESEMESGATARLVTISGNEQSVATAQHLINEIIQHQQFQRVTTYGPPPGGFSNSGQYCEVVMVSATKVGLVIGRGGETIKSIQNEYGVNLKVDPNTDANGERRVAIYGQPDSVARAKEAVYERALSQKRVGGRGSRDGPDMYAQQMQQQQQQYSYAYQTPAAYVDPQQQMQQQQQQQQQQGYDYSAYGQYDPAAYAAAYGQQQQAAAPTADGQQPAYDASQYGGYDQKAYAEYYAQYAQYYGYDPNAVAPGAPAAAGAPAGVPGAPGAPPTAEAMGNTVAATEVAGTEAQTGALGGAPPKESLSAPEGSGHGAMHNTPTTGGHTQSQQEGSSQQEGNEGSSQPGVDSQKFEQGQEDAGNDHSAADASEEPSN
ncbi:hypothetical protein BASA81_007470 [Batrachochytrium salamandrivorans]|nr:hypothetical protein BASA81_007470 [Batrachochytrium salamandrivorans]